MKYLFVIPALLLSTAVSASPFVQASVVAGVTSCGFVMDGGAKVVVAAASNLCRLDLVSLPPGNHSVTVTAISTGDPVFGTQESAATSPLAFVKPSGPPVPTGLQLTP